MENADLDLSVMQKIESLAQMLFDAETIQTLSPTANKMDFPPIVAPDLEDLTICSFCHLPFNDAEALPKLFACRHFFCLKCVNLMLRDGSDDIYCVHCWKRTELQGPEPKADNLPTYNAILQLTRNLNTFSPEATNCNDNGNVNGNALNHGNVGVIGQFTTSTTSAATSNAGGSCIIDIDDRGDRSPSISSSSGSACGSLGGSIGGSSAGNHNHTTTLNCSNNVNNVAVDFVANNCNNIEKFKVGENCLTHAMPNTLWCSICRIQLCRACAGTEEHRMHPVKNQIEAKESLHNDISTELQTMQQTLNDLQQLLQKQRDFLVKILESCTTLKTQIESELVNPIPNVEIAELRERLAKAHICLELLENQTPGDALKLYTTLHTERQRLLAKYQEMFLQCKLDDLIKSSGFVFDFDLIKKALIRLHNCIVNGDKNVANFESLGFSGGGGVDNNFGLNGLISINHNPILILANYCISQLYSRQMLAIKQQQQQQQQKQKQQQLQQVQQQQQQVQIQKQQHIQQQQLQHQQIVNANMQFNQQQQHEKMNIINQVNQQECQNHQQHQQLQQQQALFTNDLLNSMIAHASLNSTANDNHNHHNDNKCNNNNNNNSDNINSTHTTYAQALQQSTAAAAQKIAQQTGSPNAKTYADIITTSNNNNNNNNNHNKRNLNSPVLKQQQQQQQHQKLLSSQQTQSITLNGNFPELAPIGTKPALSAASSTASSASASTISSTLSVKRSSTHLFAATNGKKFNGVGLSFLHLQHHTMSARSTTSTKQQQQQQQNQAVIQSKSTPLGITPRIHIYPIYFFNIDINDKPAGRLLIEVRSDIAPKMAKNFNSLVTQQFGFGYKGCQVFQCWQNESIITGDYESNNGRGGHSVFDEPFFMPDDTKILAIRGSVGMRRSQKRHDNMGLVGSQFRIILREMPGFTGIFGFLIDGLEVVERIAQTGDNSEESNRSRTLAVQVHCIMNELLFEFFFENFSY